MLNAMQSNNSFSTPPTLPQQLEWHTRQLASYENKISSCKTKHMLNMILDRITSHKAHVTRLQIQLDNQLQTE